MIKTSFSTAVGGGDLGGDDGIGHYTMIQDGSFTMVCQDGMVECIPTGEKTTATTCGEATDGTTTLNLMVMFEPTGKPGTTQATIDRIGALPAATVTERRPGGTSEALNRAEYLLDKVLILVGIEIPLQAWGEEAMHESRATEVPKAARACPQRGEAVRAKAMLTVTVKG